MDKRMKMHVILLIAAIIVGILSVMDRNWLIALAMALVAIGQGIYVVRGLRNDGGQNPDHKE